MAKSKQSTSQRVAVINVVGLCPRLVSEKNTPFLHQFSQRKKACSTKIKPLLPAVTSTMQATFLTGKPPGDHGIVANYWYDRDYSEHRGWKQSNNLVQGKKLWETLRESQPDFTCAKVFWWNNMYSSADYTITPRPIYCADGKKVFDIQTWPMDLRDEIKTDLGEFPFPAFWGPMAGLPSSQWIAEAAKWFEKKFSPNLNLVYLPHLDYNLQRFGPEGEHISEDLNQIDQVVEELVEYFESQKVKPIILSEYGITQVDRPIHINREFRKKGWLVCRDELGRDQIDLGSCKAFAISDHQLAHIYINDPAITEEVKETVSQLMGVSEIYIGDGIAKCNLDHERSGDIVAVADQHSWFTYYYWNDETRAPDCARTVDIHRKPGYDPAELFVDPKISFPKLKVATSLARKKLGFRMLMDVIPTDANLVKGSHGCIPESEEDYAMLMAEFDKNDQPGEVIEATDVHGVLLKMCS